MDFFVPDIVFVVNFLPDNFFGKNFVPDIRDRKIY